ncbi:efflux RND transporter periplasmic adaptor subunit [Lysobacter sp. N42]|uniref:efflux RND transporter periplasmic adaptor subunit n=1 Tax=Lysobacter sp. N42 TaxID=2545719 RepID=UPI00104E9AC3|nr:efflux RND transporter periplasmic adaptor subunit [Lysobacter sp. N42]TCZ84937.1 efflux RND transporter periplasmic adaptor subunit [Lysobacter sp. N42]
MPTPTRARWRTPALVATVLVAALALGAWAWSRRDGGAEGGGWRTTQVERGDIRVSISSTGALSAISTVVVGSEISGRVTEVLVDFNDRVRKGQVLARLDPSTFQAQIAQGNAAINSAQANAAQAEAALRNAEADWRRKSDLGRQQLVARAEVDLARAALDQARAQLAAARAQIAQQQAGTRTTRLNLGRTEIRSPVDGVVLTRTIEPGQTVAASLQAPELFKLAEDLSKMEIELAVDEADIGQVKVGQAAIFTVDAFPERRFAGRVAQVRLSATTTNNVVTYPVVIAVDNADGALLPGMTANAEIVVSQKENVLRVPNAALRYKPADEDATAPAAGGAGGGVADDLQQLAGSLSLAPVQRSAFDAAMARMRERQQARQATAAAGQGSNRLFAGGPSGPGGNRRGGSPVDSGAFRQRMLERMAQQFAAFRATLAPAQQQRWDAGLTELAAARRAPVHRLVAGRPERVMVRVGASDGSFTEVSGALKEGDVVITGAERAAK